MKKHLPTLKAIKNASTGRVYAQVSHFLATKDSFTGISPHIKKATLLVLLTVCINFLLCGFTPIHNSNNTNSSLQATTYLSSTPEPTHEQTPPQKKEFIKWIDFNVSYTILDRAFKTAPKQMPELLAYTALKNGNNFTDKTQSIKHLNAAIKDPTLIDKYRENKYFKYYLESYNTILGGIIDFETGKLKGYHPIAQGFWFNCYDDFGNSRGYGFKRRHLGHDLFGSVGAPIIAVESGTVTELGWNQYGGWRIGIRSSNTTTTENTANTESSTSTRNTNNTESANDPQTSLPARYYYYAHLRKNRPFHSQIKKGDQVTAGQVIGYLGNTGYSRKENTNMKQGKPHLHFGIQIIFDESQEDGNGEIWIDCHALCRFLSRNRAKVEKNPETNEWKSIAPTKYYFNLL